MISSLGSCGLRSASQAADEFLAQLGSELQATPTSQPGQQLHQAVPANGGVSFQSLETTVSHPPTAPMARPSFLASLGNDLQPKPAPQPEPMLPQSMPSDAASLLEKSASLLENGAALLEKSMTPNDITATAAQLSTSNFSASSAAQPFSMFAGAAPTPAVGHPSMPMVPQQPGPALMPPAESTQAGMSASFQFAYQTDPMMTLTPQQAALGAALQQAQFPPAAMYPMGAGPGNCMAHPMQLSPVHQALLLQQQALAAHGPTLQGMQQPRQRRQPDSAERRRRQCRHRGSGAPLSRQGAEQVARTELAKMRQQEALLESRLLQMKEARQKEQKQAASSGAEERDSNSAFSQFLKNEYENGDYDRTF